MTQLAALLTALYEMPIKVEGTTTVRCCLEIRLTLQGTGGLRCGKAYRTDDDRQGESLERGVRFSV